METLFASGEEASLGEEIMRRVFILHQHVVIQIWELRHNLSMVI
jgi:hypothetical protein